MGIVRCENGHFYDDSRYTECPHCKLTNSEPTMRESATIAMNEEIQHYASDYIREQGVGPAEYDDEKTIALVSEYRGNDFVAGWLVCTAGPERGRQYSLYHGFNRIGRGKRNDICLSGDPKVSREPQCAVVYENKKNLFYAVPESGAIAYLNQKLLDQAVEIHTGDVVQVGETELTFVAFCEGERRW